MRCKIRRDTAENEPPRVCQKLEQKITKVGIRRGLSVGMEDYPEIPDEEYSEEETVNSETGSTGGNTWEADKKD